MTTRAWWIGITVIVLALLAHAAFPRYEWRAVPDKPGALIRIDRWTGRATWGHFSTGTWTPVR